MAEFNTKCPHCGAILVADESLIGVEAECFNCKQKFVVPPKETAANVPAPASPRQNPTPAEEPDIPLKPRRSPEAPTPAATAPKFTLPRRSPPPKPQDDSLPPSTSAGPDNSGITDQTPPRPQGAQSEIDEASFIFICPECGRPEELPLSLKGKPYECKDCCESSAAVPAEERKCPYCGESIKIKANLCKHCRKKVPPLFANSSSLPPMENMKERGAELLKNATAFVNRVFPNIPLRPRPDSDGQTEQSFIFVCPSCGQQVELPIIMKGKKYTCAACCEESIAEAVTEKKCPFCGEMVKIGAKICKYCKKDLSDDHRGVNAAPKAEETFIFICPECGRPEELPLSLKGKPYECKGCCESSAAVPAEERKCPYCGESIKIKANLCKHCRKKVPSLFAASAPFSHIGKMNGKSAGMFQNVTAFFAGFFSKFGLFDRRSPNNKRIIFIILGLIALLILMISVCNTGSSHSGSGKSINVSVTVKYWVSSAYESWKWGCEYKLFADGRLVASKESKSMSVSFDVNVPKGARLTATMASRNGFGATELHEGPWLGTTRANDSGESITIECR